MQTIMKFQKLFKGWQDVDEFKVGDVIFSAGEPAKVMYFILSGEAELNLHGERLGTENVGGIIGEMSLINSDIRSATVTARSACQLALIDESSFKSLLKHVPEFTLHVMDTLAKRLQSAYEMIEK